MLYCKRHPSYQAKRAPRGTCARCLEVYAREQRKHTVIREAAQELLRLLELDSITLEATYHRPFPFDSGVKIVITNR